MDVAIFGAGVAGLMTAIAMRAKGHRCRVYERQRRSHEAGMGFILVPAGIERLKNLGVHLTGPFSGIVLERYICRNSAGRILQQEPMPAGAKGIRRRDLMAALVSALPSDVALTFDAALEELEFGRDGSVTAARLSSGVHVTADLYVGAEGINSRARKAVFPDSSPPPEAVPEVVGLIRSPETVRWAGGNFNKFHSSRGGLAMGILPVGSDHVVWFVQVDGQRFPPPGETGSECKPYVQELVGHWAKPIPHLLAISDFSRVHLWRPIDLDMAPRFHQGNLVLVGDAAHPLLPFTSQGVSSAIADAVMLAQLTKAQNGLAQALADYSRQRHEQCAPFVARGRELMQHFLAPLDRKGIVLPIA